MKEPDSDNDLKDFNEHYMTRLERRIYNLEHAKAVSEIVINKKTGKKENVSITYSRKVVDSYAVIIVELV